MLPSIDWITSPIRIHLRNSSELFEILLRFSSDLFPDFYEIFPLKYLVFFKIGSESGRIF